MLPLACVAAAARRISFLDPDGVPDGVRTPPGAMTSAWPDTLLREPAGVCIPVAPDPEASATDVLPRADASPAGGTGPKPPEGAGASVLFAAGVMLGSVLRARRAPGRDGGTDGVSAEAREGPLVDVAEAAGVAVPPAKLRMGSGIPIEVRAPGRCWEDTADLSPTSLPRFTPGAPPAMRPP